MKTVFKAEHEKSIRLWQEEKDFFARWSMAPAEPQLLDLIESYRPESFLDVGCGGAPYLKIFAEAGMRVLGCDINPLAIEAQRRVLPHACLMQGDLFQINPSGPYDVAMARGVLYYYSGKEKREFLNRVFPFIRKALIVVETDNEESEETKDYRGIPVYYENWREFGRSLQGWSFKIIELKDPLFYTRYIQRRIPTYKPSAEVLRNKTKIMLLEKPS